MVTKEFFINTFRDAARIIDERAEEFCSDIEEERITEFTVYISISRDGTSLDVEKKYALNPFEE